MTNQQTNWMTIREAALALAVSELTIRRRIKDGRLAHRLVNGKYYIDLQSTSGTLESRDELETNRPDLTSRPDQERSRTASRPSGAWIRAEIANDHGAEASSAPYRPAEENAADTVERPWAAGFDLDALLGEHARLAKMAGRARLLEDQLAQLSARHDELREGMLSLAGRNGWLESKLEERESAIKLLTDEQPHAPWWKRLFGA
jgi:excisionase family DNA binding protein